jgi:hypothetical protein
LSRKILKKIKLFLATVLYYLGIYLLQKLCGGIIQEKRKNVLRRVYHQKIMKGSRIETSYSSVYLCIGEKHSVTVDQEFDIYEEHKDHQNY